MARACPAEIKSYSEFRSLPSPGHSILFRNDPGLKQFFLPSVEGDCKILQLAHKQLGRNAPVTMNPCFA